MRKIMLITLLLVFCVAQAWAHETKETFNFRGVEFGMTQEQVNFIETGEMNGEQNKNLITYYQLEDIYGVKANCRYYFSNSHELERILLVLIIPETYNFISKYNEIFVDLLGKYKTDDEEAVYSMYMHGYTTLTPWYFIQNEETLTPGILVSLTYLANPGSYDHSIFFIYFNRMDNVNTIDSLKNYQDQLKPVKPKTLNKIIAGNSVMTDMWCVFKGSFVYIPPYFIGAVLYFIVLIFIFSIKPFALFLKKYNISAFVIIFSTVVPLAGLVKLWQNIFYYDSVLSWILPFWNIVGVLFLMGQICWLGILFTVMQLLSKKHKKLFFNISRGLIIGAIAISFGIIVVNFIVTLGYYNFI